MSTKRKSLTSLIIFSLGLIVLLLPGGPLLNAHDAGSDAKNDSDSICATSCPTLGWNNSGSQYSEVEQKLIHYFCDRIAATGQVKFDIDEVSEATGISADVLEGMALSKLQPAIMTELSQRKVDLSGLAGASCGNCSRFSACSVDRDLSGATGEELVRYEQEKAQDGMTFSDWQAPDFTLPTTDSKEVTLSDYTGGPVVLTFLSGHCSHSFDTLPILKSLKQKYEPQGLAILPVYVNSGSVDNVLSWSSEMNLGYSLVVSKTKEVSNAYDSRMLPSTFLIDTQGKIVQKFVGYKSRSELDAAIEGLMSGSL